MPRESLETLATKVRISTYTRRAGGVRTLVYPFPQGGERLRALRVERAYDREEQEGRMLNKNSALGRRPLWILTSYQHNQMQPLTLDPDGDGGFLPVFSFEEEAQAFLQLLGEEGKGTGWRIRETTAGELISVLLGLCAQVKRVALDPLPLSCGGAVLPFMSVKRNHFVQDLMEEGRRRTGKLLPV